MSADMSDRSKRQPAVKRMDDCDAIPWSQQVDEDLCENSSYTTENKSENNSVAQFQNPPFVLQADTCRSQKQKHKYTNEIKNKLRQSFERIDVMKSNGNYSAEKINLLNVSYNPKKDNYNSSLKMSSEETRKPYFGDTSGGVQETHTKGNDSPDKNSLMSNESNKKKITWASIASQPAKPNKRNNITLKKKGPGMPPPPMIPGKHALNVNAWDLARNSPSTESCGYIPNCIPIIESETSPEDDLSAKWKPQNAEQHPDFSWKQPNVYYNKRIKNTKSYSSSVEIMVDRSIVPKHHEEQNQKIKQTNVSYIHNVKETFKGESSARCSGSDSSTFLKTECLQLNTPDLSEIVLKQLKDRNNYNPSELDTQNAALSRYFVIKSYSEDDIHRSIKYEIWCSTDHGNKKLDEAFKERMEEGGNVILFFSVNGSGHFCGMAQMMTSVDYKSTASVWSQDKWKGKFKVKWIYVKDVPNSQLRHIRLENNENKSVTNSRDTQEIPLSQGLQMLKILHLYKHLTSIFDDFYHYEKKQEESVSKKPSHFDNHVHSLPSSNVGHSDTKELYNEWHTGHFKERTMFHRGEHLNTPRNRRYGKHMEPKRNLDVQEKVTCYNNPDKQDNEDSKHILEKHSNPSIDNAGSKSNYKEIILNVNSFNCNDNSIVRENMHTK